MQVGVGAYNAVQAVRDKEGMMSGSVSFADEIHDSSSNALLGAYVARGRALQAAACAPAGISVPPIAAAMPR